MVIKIRLLIKKSYSKRTNYGYLETYSGEYIKLVFRPSSSDSETLREKTNFIFGYLKDFIETLGFQLVENKPLDTRLIQKWNKEQLEKSKCTQDAIM